MRAPLDRSLPEARDPPSARALSLPTLLRCAIQRLADSQARSAPRQVPGFPPPSGESRPSRTPSRSVSGNPPPTNERDAEEAVRSASQPLQRRGGEERAANRTHDLTACTAVRSPAVDAGYAMLAIRRLRARDPAGEEDLRVAAALDFPLSRSPGIPNTIGRSFVQRKETVPPRWIRCGVVRSRYAGRRRRPR